MEGIKRISGSITAFDIRENIKYYTTSFVEKNMLPKRPLVMKIDSFEFCIATRLSMLYFNDIKVHTNLEFNSVRSMKKTYCLQHNITEVIDFVVPI